MATKKKSVVTEVASALGAAAARVENLTPMRATTATKHVKAKSTVVPVPAEAAPMSQLSEREEVEIVAYLYAEARGFVGGSEHDDWTRAEQEVRRRRAAK